MSKVERIMRRELKSLRIVQLTRPGNWASGCENPPANPGTKEDGMKQVGSRGPDRKYPRAHQTCKKSLLGPPPVVPAAIHQRDLVQPAAAAPRLPHLLCHDSAPSRRSRHLPYWQAGGRTMTQ